MLSHFLRAMRRFRSLPCPAGVEGPGDPTGEAEEAPATTKSDSGSFSSEKDKTGAARGRFFPSRWPWLIIEELAA